MHETDADRQLISTWLRHDWCRSIFAPDVNIVQALTAGGATASGLGDTREDAFGRCLSETAENLAVAALRQDAATAAAGFSSQDGLSAHPDPQIARLEASYEAQERLAVSQWWLGLRTARRVPDGWLRAEGVSDLISKRRASAAIRRETGFWQLEPQDGIHVVICLSRYHNGQDPIPGFGASASFPDAVDKALRENLLMELNLIEVLAARSGHSEMDMSRIESKIANYTARAPAILPETEAAPPPATSERNPAQVQARLSPTPVLSDVTPPGQTRQVWKCHIPAQSAFRPESRGSPFF